MKQLTIRGFDQQLERKLRELARELGISLNQAALRLMRKAAGLDAAGPSEDLVGDALDPFIGSWSDEQADEVRRAAGDLRRIDPTFWQ